MISQDGDTLIYQRRGRPPVVLGHITDADRYRALLSYNVKPVIAQAVAAKLITIRLAA